MNEDFKHLKLLATFHYVVAGLTGLFSLFPVIHLVIGIGMITGTIQSDDGSAQAGGWFFVVLATIFILAGLLFSACLAVAGRFLSQKRHYTYCLVMAGLACLFMPFGTVLGVFTIVILLKESVKEAFRQS
jgi:hypothetical protein